VKKATSTLNSPSLVFNLMFDYRKRCFPPSLAQPSNPNSPPKPYKRLFIDFVYFSWMCDTCNSSKRGLSSFSRIKECLPLPHFTFILNVKLLCPNLSHSSLSPILLSFISQACSKYLLKLASNKMNLWRKLLVLGVFLMLGLDLHRR
jgi:hypothetical protein